MMLMRGGLEEADNVDEGSMGGTIGDDGARGLALLIRSRCQLRRPLSGGGEKRERERNKG